MSLHHTPGGGAVCQLSELPPLEQRIVRYLRLWSDGSVGQSALWDDLVEHHGPAAALIALQNLESLLRQTMSRARQPLRRHATTCPCAGGDECVLARFVALATEGAREEAVLMAALIVQADFSFGLVRIAEELGLTLLGVNHLPDFTRRVVH